MNNIDLGWAGIIHWPVEEVVASMATTIKHDALISVVCKELELHQKKSPLHTLKSMDWLNLLIHVMTFLHG